MRLLTGDSREKLKDLPDNSVDSLVTDPPYLINFAGKDWDKQNSPAGDPSFWEEVLRVMKPGAHGLVFGHSRQHHRVMTALEDAGFEIRDCLMWLYGEGFPKSHPIAVYIDKIIDGGKCRSIVRKGLGNLNGKFGEAYKNFKSQSKNHQIKHPEARAWEGWGTCLKPAYEPIILIRKPLDKNLSITKNVLKHGTGGLNIDASRIPDDKPENLGRFPANVILDPVSAEMVDKQQEQASRFFYCAKAGKKEKNAGCEKNTHPTVKPIKLMTYLTKLITRPNGVVLDPFMGSGSTGCACALEGFDFIGIEMDPDYVEISKARIDYYTTK